MMRKSVIVKVLYNLVAVALTVSLLQLQQYIDLTRRLQVAYDGDAGSTRRDGDANEAVVHRSRGDCNNMIVLSNGSSICLHDRELPQRMLFDAVSFNYQAAIDVLEDRVLEDHVLEDHVLEDPEDYSSRVRVRVLEVPEDYNSSRRRLMAQNLLNVARSKWEFMNSSSTDAAIGQISRIQGMLSEDISTNAIAVSKLYHLNAMQSQLMLGTRSEDTALAYNRLGLFLGEQGRWSEALRAFRRAASIFATTGRNDNVGRMYGSIGRAAFELEDFWGAVKYSKRAIDLLTGALGERHPDTANVLRQLRGSLVAWGENAYRSGDEDTALERLREALSIIHNKEIVFDAAAAGRYHHQAGHILLEKGDRNGALEEMETAVQIMEPHFGAEDPRVSKMFDTVAKILKSMGRNEDALSYYSRALPGLVKQVGSEHAFVMVVKNEMGQLKLLTKDYEGAIADFSDALGIAQKKLNPGDTQFGDLHHNIGYAHYQAGNHLAAKEEYKAAIAVEPREDFRTIFASTIMQLFFQKKGQRDFEAALAYLNEYFQVVEGSYDNVQHRMFCLTLHFWIGEMHLKTNDYNAAVAEFNKTLSDLDELKERGILTEEQDKEFRRLVAEKLYFIGDMYSEVREDYECAMGALEDALKIYHSVDDGYESMDVARTHFAMGTVLAETGRYSDAILEIQKAISIAPLADFYDELEVIQAVIASEESH